MEPNRDNRWACCMGCKCPLLSIESVMVQCEGVAAYYGLQCSVTKCKRCTEYSAFIQFQAMDQVVLGYQRAVP